VSTDPGAYARSVEAINMRFQGDAVRLRKELDALALEHHILLNPKFGLLPGMTRKDVPNREEKLREVAQKIEQTAAALNEVMRRWQFALRSLPPPPTSGDWIKKIPWPEWVPQGLRDYIIKSIKAGGLGITDSVSLTKTDGMWGVAIQYKW
jgi:hypothetical protein